MFCIEGLLKKTFHRYTEEFVSHCLYIYILILYIMRGQGSRNGTNFFCAIFPLNFETFFFLSPSILS